MDMWTILTETILGALTGYVTNDVAVRQLFRPGGIIEKERRGFIDMITAVLEEDIFGPDVMAKLAAEPETQAVFEALAAHLLRRVLPQTVQGARADDGDEGQALRSLLTERIGRAAWPPLELRPDFVADRLAALEASGAFHEALTAALTDLASHSPDDLGLAEFLPPAVMAEKLDKQAVVTFLRGHRGLIEEELSATLTALADHPLWRDQALAAFLKEAPESLADRTVSHLFKALEQAQPRILEAVKAWAKTPGATEHLASFVRRQVEAVVDVVLPELWPTGTAFLQAERPELEKMVLAAVDEALADSSLKTPIRRAVEGYFAGAEGSNWLSHLFIEWQTPDKQAALREQVVEGLMAQVKQAAAKWYAGEGVLRQDRGIGEAWARPLQEKLTQLLHRSAADLLENFIGIDRASKWLYRLLLAVAEGTEALPGLLERSDHWRQMPLADKVLPPDRCALLAQGLTDRLSSVDWTQARENLARLPVAPQMATLTGRFLHQPLSQQLEALQEHTSVRAQVEARLAARLGDYIFTDMSAHLGNLARKQLEALSHQEMRHLALDLLGREMRPLSAIGGVVGGAVGFASGTALTLTGFQLTTPDEDWLLYSAAFAGRCGLYGAVGYGTNVLAVQGLFKPYKKRGGWQGLVPKNQHRFARKMKKLTEGYVINEEIWSGLQDRLAEEARASTWADLVPQMAAWRSGSGAYLNDLLDHLLGQYSLATGLGQVTSEDWLKALALFFDHRPQGSLAARLLAALLRRLPYLLNDESQIEAQMAHMMERLTDVVLKALTEKLSTLSGAALCEGLDRVAGRLQLPAADHALYGSLAEGLMLAYDQLPTRLAPQIPRLSKRLAGRIRGHLPMSVDFLFGLMNGNRLIEGVLDCLVTRHLPAYLADRRDVYSRQAEAVCADVLAGRSLRDLGLDFKDEDVEALLTTVVKAGGQGLDSLDGRKGASFIRRLTPVLEKLALHSAQALAPRQGQASPALLWLSRRLEETYALASPVQKRLLVGHCRSLVHAAPVQLFFDLSPRDLLPAAVWAAYRDTAVRLLTAPDDHELEEALLARVEVIFDKGWDELSPLFASYGQLLIAVLQLPQVAQMQINQLSPALLESMVRNIANPYFRHVERMGALGAVVAVPATIIAQMIN